MILPLGLVLDAPSKNIFHTSSSEVILDSKISFGVLHEVLSFLEPDEPLESLQALDL